MTTTQTIKLDDSERLALQKALFIIDNLAEIAEVSMESVFDYLFKVAVFKEDYREYHIKAIHIIDEIRQ